MMAIDKMSSLLASQSGVKGIGLRPKYSSIDDIVHSHFQDYSDLNHPCKNTLSLALQILAGRPAHIVETGSSAWGVNSSLLLDSYVNSFGGYFSTVDIRISPSIKLRKLCTNKTTLFCKDSVGFLTGYGSSRPFIDMLYLDSWDVDWNAPLSSAIHGLHEFLSALPWMRPGSILLIDDTPKTSEILSRVNPEGCDGYKKFALQYAMPPGKGGLVKEYLLKNKIGKEVAHEYQLLWQL